MIILQAIKEIRKLRKQLTSEINLSVAGVDANIDPEMKPPSDNQARLLRQLVLSGLGDQVGRKIGLDEVKEGMDTLLLKAEKFRCKVAFLCQLFSEGTGVPSEKAIDVPAAKWRLAEWQSY